MTESARRAFMIFHVVLAGGLLIMGIQTLSHSLQEPHVHVHLTFVAGLQVLGAILLLSPRTARVGGAVLLLILLVGFTAEALRGNWQLRHLILAAGVWLIMVQRPVWVKKSPV